MKKLIYHPITVWTITVMVFLLFLFNGMTKLMTPGVYSELWTTWGVPAIFVYIVGVLEITGSLAVLNPKFAAIPALCLSVLMVIAAALCFKNGVPGHGWTSVGAFILTLCLSLIRKRDLFYKNRT